MNFDFTLNAVDETRVKTCNLHSEQSKYLHPVVTGSLVRTCYLNHGKKVKWVRLHGWNTIGENNALLPKVQTGSVIIREQDVHSVVCRPYMRKMEARDEG